MTENEQVRSVLNANPTLPIVLLTEAVGNWDDYQYYYHEGIEAKVEWLLNADRLHDRLGTAFGLRLEKIYSDEDKAAEDISEALYDNGRLPWDDASECDRIARMIVDDLPWEETVVIWGCL